MMQQQSPREYLEHEGIKYKPVSQDGKEVRFPCPKCDNDEGFSFNLSSGVWCCLRSSCLAKGNYHQFKVLRGHAYELPPAKKEREEPDGLAVALEAAFSGETVPDDPVSCWMLALRNSPGAKNARKYLYQTRRLRPEVLELARIGWMPDRFKQQKQDPRRRPKSAPLDSNGWITIPYPIPKDFGQKGLVKLRAVPPEQTDEKGRPIRYRRIPGAKSALYSPFGITGEKPLFLIGGEIDLLSVKQAYMDAKIDCPYDLGAPTSESSFTAMAEEIDAQGEDVIIGFDNDAAGLVAADKAATVIGRWRCRIAKWPDGYKDANAVLQAGKLTPETIDDMIKNSKPAVGQKINTTDSYADRVIAAIRRPGSEGWSTGLPTLDEHLGGGLRPGNTSVITGHTNSGKSILVSQISLEFARRLQGVFFCPFELGVDDQIVRSVQQWSKRDPNKMTDLEIRQSIKQIGDQIYWFDHYGSIDIDVFVETVTYVTRRLNVKLCVFDNRDFMLGRNDPNRWDNQDELGLRIVQAFRPTDVHALLVIHPNKPPVSSRDRDDWMPQLGDAKGHGDIYQDVDNYLSTYRPRTSDRADERDDTGCYPAAVCVMKCRSTKGREGTIDLRYDPDSLWFYDVAASSQEMPFNKF